MSVITIFSATNCREQYIAEKVAADLDCKLLTKEILELAAQRFGVTVPKLENAMGGPISIFNNFTREKEKNIVYIKAALASLLQQDNVVYLGRASHLVPRNINHVLRVCLTATRDFRVSTAKSNSGALSEKDVVKAMNKEDHEVAQWTHELFERGPWDRNLYDIKLPMDKTEVDEAIAIICDNVRKDVVKKTPESTIAMQDFGLAAETHVQLVKEGHFDIDVVCNNGFVTIFINKHVFRLERLISELETIAAKTPGAKKVTAKAGPDFYKADIYRKQDFERPQKVLLVDDETEYVQTLSERLQMREFGTAVAHNGEEAMSMVRKEEPEVMVLDLRMPGIDGMEVLRKLKQEHANVEVIILTGHGTERDRELAMQLGAFAYLEKPVDIDKLSQTMKAAYQEAQQKKI